MSWTCLKNKLFHGGSFIGGSCGGGSSIVDAILFRLGACGRCITRSPGHKHRALRSIGGMCSDMKLAANKR
eukprot:6022793-Amphidinium_carterae.1